MPACEDYDLWLRVSCRYPVHLLNDPLILKQGGHEDQLSNAAGLDKCGIQSLKKIIDAGQLAESQCRAADRTLHKKCAVYAARCRIRGRQEAAQYYENLAKGTGCLKADDGEQRATDRGEIIKSETLPPWIGVLFLWLDRSIPLWSRIWSVITYGSNRSTADAE
jgi:hypothetical protein